MAPVSQVRFTTRIDVLGHLKMHYLRVSRTIIKKLGGAMNQRLLCTVNNSLTWQCGMVALEKGDAYISINKKIMKELGVKAGQEVKVTLKKDTSKYGMEMPVELKTLLAQDKEGNRRFHLLAPGKLRYIIYFVSQLKTSQKRVDRAIRLIENLKRTVEGKESFREILEVKRKNPN